jgi:hypothetical protein
MKTIRRACRCGATIAYTDEPWRVDLATTEWDAMHTGEMHGECEYLDAVKVREDRDRQQFNDSNQGRN